MSEKGRQRTLYVYTTIYDRTGRLTAMSAEFARCFDLDPETEIGTFPPFPWWPEEGRDQFQALFEVAVSEAGVKFEGLEVIAELGGKLGEIAPHILRLQRLPNGSTAIHAEPFARDQYGEIAERAIELGRLAELVAAGTPTTDSRGLLRQLSARERTVVDMLLRGDRIDQVAQDLHLSVHTVRNHRKAIYRKLGVQSQVELITKLGTSRD